MQNLQQNKTQSCMITLTQIMQDLQNEKGNSSGNPYSKSRDNMI